MKQYSRILSKEVKKYKDWIKKYYPEMNEDNDNGLHIGPSFFKMRKLAISFIENVELRYITEEDLDSLLYCVARDNESEVLADYISSKKEWFAFLVEKCIDTIYTTAKWQFVKRLPIYKDDNTIADWVFKYINIDDEYTQRMSLEALSEIYPQKAEKYAVDFWERDKYKDDAYSEEYQKIMVLDVLAKIKSDKLGKYIEEAKLSNFFYLKENANKIAKENNLM